MFNYVYKYMYIYKYIYINTAMGRNLGYKSAVELENFLIVDVIVQVFSTSENSFYLFCFNLKKKKNPNCIPHLLLIPGGRNCYHFPEYLINKIFCWKYF